MTDFEGELKAAMSAAVANTEPPRRLMEVVRRRYRRRTARMAVGSAAVIGLVVAAVPSIGGLWGVGVHTSPAVPATRVPASYVRVSPAVMRRLWRISQRVAAANGDRRPRYVLAVGPVDHQRAERALSGALVIGHERVYAVEIRGHFACGLCSTPPGVRAPAGTVITLTVQVRTWAVLDFGLGQRWARLSRLGHRFALRR